MPAQPRLDLPHTAQGGAAITLPSNGKPVFRGTSRIRCANGFTSSTVIAERSGSINDCGFPNPRRPLLGRTTPGHVPNGGYADATAVCFGIVALDQ
jgi:hypothetical protein